MDIKEYQRHHRHHDKPLSTSCRTGFGLDGKNGQFRTHKLTITETLTYLCNSQVHKFANTVQSNTYAYINPETDRTRRKYEIYALIANQFLADSTGSRLQPWQNLANVLDIHQACALWVRRGRVVFCSGQNWSELCQMGRLRATWNNLERPGTTWNKLGRLGEVCIAINCHRTLYSRFVVRQENNSVIGTPPDCWRSKNDMAVTSISSTNSSESRWHSQSITKLYASWSLGPLSSNYIKTASPATGEAPRPRAELTLINVYLIVLSGFEMLDEIPSYSKAWFHVRPCKTAKNKLLDIPVSPIFLDAQAHFTGQVPKGQLQHGLEDRLA